MRVASQVLLPHPLLYQGPDFSISHEGFSCLILLSLTNRNTAVLLLTRSGEQRDVVVVEEPEDQAHLPRRPR